jgi:cytidine deaminase
MAPRKTPRIDWSALGVRAKEVRTSGSYAPYSRFQVGAALLTSSGTIYGGANVENATYGLCVCAERVAITQAVVAGDRELTALVVATQSNPPSPPCGLCLQTLAEFAGDLPIRLISTRGGERRTTLKKLFPGAFSGALLRS